MKIRYVRAKRVPEELIKIYKLVLDENYKISVTGVQEGQYFLKAKSPRLLLRIRDGLQESFVLRPPEREINRSGHGCQNL